MKRHIPTFDEFVSEQVNPNFDPATASQEDIEVSVVKSLEELEGIYLKRAQQLTSTLDKYEGHYKYFEVSALENINIQELFIAIAKELAKKQKLNSSKQSFRLHSFITDCSIKHK